MQAELNMEGRKNCEVITASAESALDYLNGEEIVILDPPRAGLHKDVADKLIETKPARIIYLSCNPSTQARDISLFVESGYSITHARGYNFFPRTPHIESLIILDTVQ
jgi:23S rRNA (uracil1939-C5)-methyltransferase